MVMVRIPDDTLNEFHFFSSQSIAMELKEAILDLQDQVNVTKEQINVDSEELKMMIRYPYRKCNMAVCFYCASYLFQNLYQTFPVYLS